VALTARGLDASTHRSREISREILESFDLVLTMENNHKEALQFEFQDLANRVFLLSEMVEQNFDIADPIGGSQSDYERTADQISQILRDGFDKIVRLATDLESKDSDFLLRKTRTWCV
jgi:protein-tyrosine-phosphatase